MAEYIEREALVKVLRGSAVAKYPASFTMGLLAAADEASKIPVAADVEPVVHCKDCIGKQYWYKNNYGCTICGLSGLYVVEDNDFCSYGERKS